LDSRSRIRFIGVLEPGRKGETPWTQLKSAVSASSLPELNREQDVLNYMSSKEGLLLITQLVVSQRKFLFHVGEMAPTRGGYRRVFGELNLDTRFDSRINPRRHGARKLPMEIPPEYFDSLVAINPEATWYNLDFGRVVPFNCIVFHELAEAYAKAVLGLQYLPTDGLPGAHQVALNREHNFRSQRPFSGIVLTAGVSRLFNTKKQWNDFVAAMRSSTQRDELDSDLLRSVLRLQEQAGVCQRPSAVNNGCNRRPPSVRPVGSDR
ncbi:MAG TPA: hypothetical protein VEZ90_17635, partial [Blastocatellia bacterium]|nr:hypothetical protein [Blastocatellia bacterium]